MLLVHHTHPAGPWSTDLEAELERTGVMLEGGKVAISALTYADDSALTRDDKPEASRRVSAVRLGFHEDGDKEVSQPKTEAMRVARQLVATSSTEVEYSAALDHECEFCGKAFEKESNRHQHQTRQCPTNGKPWWPLAHHERTEEALEVELILDVRGAPERGRRFHLVKWLGFDDDPMEESTWETVEDLL
jgi:hypothetical protein